jgi:hypothetical protein
MGRAPFQVLVFPFRPTQAGDWEFAVFQRADGDWWQGIAGLRGPKRKDQDLERRPPHRILPPPASAVLHT